MIESSDVIEGAVVCGLCTSSLTATRYVHAVEGSSFYILCSKECFRVAARQHRRLRWAARGRSARRLTLGLVFAGAYLAPHQGPPRTRPIPRAVAAPAPKQAGAPALPSGWFGPEWPPTEIDALAALGRDAWVHPLAGPLRRMPRSDSRVFGAARPGDRAVECRNGHCGVDLGGEIWGEQVHAVHDGVVDWVKRGVNPDRGGQFVRLAHRNGTVFTQYFHLAAIARGLERGTPVQSGDVIGLLGDTGVKESGPHLHFTISIRPAKESPEKYIDPEPLLALWPLRVPVDGSEVGLVTTVARPGVPLGSAPLIPGRKRRLARQGRAGGEVGASEKGRPARGRSLPAGDAPSAPAEADEPATED
jgi:murein DD-endopeptidase MepM/ murein hydrolase activator NlpD